MVDSGCKKIQVKKKRRRSDGEKNMDDIHRPYLIQRVLAAPRFLASTLYTLHPTPINEIREICGNFYPLLS